MIDDATVSNLAGEIIDLFWTSGIDDWYRVFYNGISFDSFKGLIINENNDITRHFDKNDSSRRLNPYILNLLTDGAMYYLFYNFVPDDFGRENDWQLEERNRFKRLKRLFRRILDRYGLEYKLSYWNVVSLICKECDKSCNRCHVLESTVI
jgi:hypothetical protein